MPRIIISYRRADSAGIAGRIFDRLVEHYGNSAVFIDVDSIPLGADFRQHIQDELRGCDILLALIGPRWIGSGKRGQTRINREDAPVRIEIETAMRDNITIVPVRVDGAAMPKPGQLRSSYQTQSQVFHYLQQSRDRLLRQGRA
jgi:hypothetical protein